MWNAAGLDHPCKVTFVQPCATTWSLGNDAPGTMLEACHRQETAVNRTHLSDNHIIPGAEYKDLKRLGLDRIHRWGDKVWGIPGLTAHSTLSCPLYPKDFAMKVQVQETEHELPDNEGAMEMYRNYMARADHKQALADYMIFMPFDTQAEDVQEWD